MKLTRYPEEEVVGSALNHFEDLIDWLGYLTSADFVLSLLRSVYGSSAPDAKDRAAKIIYHAKYAVAYLKQAESGPCEVAFLPAYYAILNLSKIYILAGNYYSEFTHHSRWHGATYNVQEKDSHTLLTEQITLHEGGALALFHKTLTGTAIKGRKNVRIGELYPYIIDVGAEYSLATGEQQSILFVNFSPRLKEGKLTIEAHLENKSLPSDFSIRHAPALKGFRKKAGDARVLQKYVGVCPKDKVKERMRASVDTKYMFLSSHKRSITCYRRSNLKFTEEFPLALAFFHLSSVCRYKPEFLDRLAKSKYWPVLLALRRHGLFKFLLLTWSFLSKKDYHITVDSIL